MTVSSYQVELLVRRFRRWMDWAAGPLPAPPDQEEAVELSDTGRAWAQESSTVTPRQGSGPDVSNPALVADRRVRAPAVEAELERRAGSFLRPPLPNPPEHNPIPRLRRRTTA